jgi:hypothetical protein
MPASVAWPMAVLVAFATATGPVLAEASGAPCTPETGLNHFYVVLDEETFAAVRTSTFFLGRFAAVDAGLPAFAAPDSVSQRLFVRGKTTYLELFRPDNHFGEPVGKVGIALGVDRLEDLDCVHRLWEDQLDSGTERRRVERQADDELVPWYDAVYHPATSLNPDLVLWAVGYLPEFLPWLYPDRPAEATGGSRGDFLAPRFDSTRLLRDVVGLVVAVPAELRSTIADQLEAIGYARREYGDATVLSTTEWSLTLAEPTGDRRGLLAVDFSTNHEHEGLGIVYLGSRSLLTFGPAQRASWYVR